MKLKFKKMGIEAEGDVEGVVKNLLDNHEKDWKEKFDSKHSAKKEIMELKHKYKLEEQNRKKSINMDLGIEYERKRAELEREKEINNMESKAKTRTKITSIILFFVYGIFCIVGFKDEHMVSAIISLIQIAFVLISILTSMEIFKLFKNDYKMFLILSIILIIPWLAFAV